MQSSIIRLWNLGFVFIIWVKISKTILIAHNIKTAVLVLFPISGGIILVDGSPLNLVIGHGYKLGMYICVFSKLKQLISRVTMVMHA